MLATLPVDDPEPECGAGARGEGKPARLVAKAEPPAKPASKKLKAPTFPQVFAKK
jgi:hypothetical protein